ncbi:TPA: hypothetical protein HA291_04055, partial [Candidatus Micrarchaeota archaeon]|nr:hypothetical protein [Candidatus Micrarchaeota archaeon]HII10426.1 hypothetical protein [Candidatus Micrarchaeota archaeon]
VAELPTLVTPNSEKVTEKANWIKSKFLNYTYDKDFYDASMMAFGFVNDETEDVVLPLQFWISPDEVITFMMGDIMDKAILLCSLLIKLGNPSARVFVKMDDSARRVFVYHEFGSKFHVLECGKEKREFNSRDDVLQSLQFNEDTVAYEFNNQMYADLY